MRSTVYVLYFFLFSLGVQAQSPFAPLNTDYYHLIDRLEIRQNRWAEGFHSSVKPYNRQSIVQLVDSVEAHPLRDLSDTDYFNFAYLRNDSWEWVTNPDTLQRDLFTRSLKTLSSAGESNKPIFKHFYQKKADFYSLQTPDFDLHVNPVLNLGVGIDRTASQSDVQTTKQQLLFVNTRGVEVTRNYWQETWLLHLLLR